MTTNELRKKIEICGYGRSPHSEIDAHIYYAYDNEARALELSKDDLISELTAISSIDSPEEINKYNLCQWDALCLVIRHELKEATDKEIEHLFKL